MTTWYLSGPMSGIDEFNFPAFAYAAKELRAQGLTIISPHENDVIDQGEWSDYLRVDLVRMLEQCDGIILLRGWTKSRGAKLELFVAMSLDCSVAYFDECRNRLVNMERGGVNAPTLTTGP